MQDVFRNFALYDTQESCMHAHRMRVTVPFTVLTRVYYTKSPLSKFRI